MRAQQLLICVATVLCICCTQHEHTSHQSGTYEISQPLKADTLIYQEYVAQIRSIQHIEVRALEKGYLQKIYVDEGQHVKKGQILFQIQPVIYQAESKKAEAEVSFADIEYQNTKALADSNVVSKNELALSKARLEKAKAEWTLAQAHLHFTEIRAPFDGIVGRFHDVRLGSLVDEGELLTTLSDNTKMWVYFNVPETEYLEYASRPKHTQARESQVKLQLANRQLFTEDGIVETIEADINNETGNIAFRATFDNKEGLLRNGGTGNILLPVPLANALLIPQKATYEILDKKYVFVVKNDDTVEAREIKVGTEMPHLYVVTDGISSDEKILLEGLRKVKHGDKISTKFIGPKEAIAQLHSLHAE
jgi:membrane fusion protein (multidrug efflux system)